MDSARVYFPGFILGNLPGPVGQYCLMGGLYLAQVARGDLENTLKWGSPGVIDRLFYWICSCRSIGRESSLLHRTWYHCNSGDPPAEAIKSTGENILHFGGIGPGGSGLCGDSGFTVFLDISGVTLPFTQDLNGIGARASQ